jgi:hypothetical protein
MLSQSMLSKLQSLNHSLVQINFNLIFKSYPLAAFELDDRRPKKPTARENHPRTFWFSRRN